MYKTHQIALVAALTALSAGLSLSVNEGTEKTAEQIAAEKAEAAAAKKAAAQQAKAEKAEAAAKAKAEKQAAAEAAKAQREEAKAKATAEKEAQKAAAAEAKRLEAEKKAAERAAKAESKVKVVMPSQNGITRPKNDTKTGSVWALADKLSADKNAPVAISELMPHALAAGLNDATIRTQYARWKQFHGIYGAVAKAAPAPAANEGEAQVAA